ncbi:hypothetical protein L6R52_08605 [Myxococcota bacterium]|nr:hypothetical protein [Myxococcota bacterium]
MNRCVVLSFTLLTACSGPESNFGLPYVQDSAEASPRWQVFINRVTDGIYRSYQPSCLDGVRIGHVVEFMNFLPEVPANVTSISGPVPLYSPNLMRPYNYVGPDDPENQLCDQVEGDRCVQRPSWSFWRFAFTTPGVYDWLDSNQGEPGRKVVDPYYGTETFIGLDPNAKLATICVENADGTGCEGVCCQTDADCQGRNRCVKGPVDAVGRCRTPS